MLLINCACVLRSLFKVTTRSPFRSPRPARKRCQKIALSFLWVPQFSAKEPYFLPKSPIKGLSILFQKWKSPVFWKKADLFEKGLSFLFPSYRPIIPFSKGALWFHLLQKMLIFPFFKTELYDSIFQKRALSFPLLKRRRIFTLLLTSSDEEEVRIHTDVCIYIYIYIYIYLYMYIHLYVYICIHFSVSMYLYMPSPRRKRCEYTQM